MRKIKKLASLLLAVIMIISLATTAFAADEEGETTETPAQTTINSITIESAVSGETYKLYKLFDLSVDLTKGEAGAFTYTVNSNWTDFFAEDGAGRSYVIFDGQGYVTAISDAKELAKAAAVAAENKTELDSKTADTTSVAFENLENGYYLITSTLGTFAMTETTPSKTEVKISEKNPQDTIVKTVKEDSTGDYGASNDAQIGDTVEFKSTITLHPGTRNVAVHDTMDTGLTLNSDSIAIDGLTEGVEYTPVTNITDGCTFEIIFTDSYLNGLTAETTLTLTYTAVLNKNAVAETEENGISIVDQKNVTKITFGDAQSVTRETTTTTHKFSVHKYADGFDYLADAVFSLKKAGVVVKLVLLDANNYRVANGDEDGAVETFTTVDTGDIVIWGVDADGDYTLEEINAPAGYNKLSEGVTVDVAAENNTKIDVENKAGTELPSTGGVGTTLFYIFGGLLVVAAVVLLVTKKRMTAE